jgi:protein phosphatase 1L
LGQGGSTAVTAILVNGRKLWVANVGDSRAVLLKGGQAIPMSTDHDPNVERSVIENRGGFVSNMPGVPQFFNSINILLPPFTFKCYFSFGHGN